MWSLKLSRRAGATAMLCLLATATSQAATVTYQDSLATDDARYALTFNLAAPTILNAYTSSWANGGFAPVLTLFGGAGGYLQASGSANVCGSPTAGAADPVSGFCWDASLSALLDAGSYTLVLTQDGNMANGNSLADGFSLDGWADYTSQMYLGVGGGRCINIDATQRSCDFALTVDLAAVGGAPIPEPGSMALLGAGMLAAYSLRRRRRATTPATTLP